MKRTRMLFIIALLVLAGLSVAEKPKELKWITVRLQAIQLCDDDGGRLTPFDVKKMQEQIEWSNVAYRDAHVRFVWDAEKDRSVLRNTHINTMESTPTFSWAQLKAACHEEARKYPNKFPLFFRYGNGKEPQGGSFSGGDLLFVASCSTDGWGDRYWVLAHEISHTLSLPHPHGGPEFATVKDAEKYFIEHGSDPNVFDGDGIADTPPFPAIPSTYWEDDKNTITVCGVNFTIPRGNVPSYTYAHDKSKNGIPLTPTQIRRVRWYLEYRCKNKMLFSDNTGMNGVVEGEDLPVLSQKDCSLTKQDMRGYDQTKWSGNTQAFVGDCKKGSSITWQLDVASPGRYQMALGLTYASDFGKIRVFVDDLPVGKVIDCFGPEAVLASGKINLGVVDLSAGKHRLAIKVVDKHQDSKGYFFGLDCVSLVRL